MSPARPQFLLSPVPARVESGQALDFPEQEDKYPINEMDIRTSDIFIIAVLVVATAIASDIARHYAEIWVWGLFIGIVTFAYIAGLRRGIKRR